MLKGHASLKWPKARDGVLGEVRQARFSPDGTRALTVSRDLFALIEHNESRKEEVPFTPVRIWDVERGKEFFSLKGNIFYEHPLGAFSYSCLNAFFSPDGNEVITADGDEDVHGSFRPDGKRTGDGSRNSLGILSVKGQAIFPRPAARVWSANGGELLRTITSEVGSIYVILSGDGSRAFTAYKSASIIWDLRTGKELCRLSDPGSVSASVPEWAVFSPDARRLFTAHSRSGRLWDARSGQQLAVLEARDVSESDRKQRASHGAAISFAVFSQDGRRLVTTSQDRTARIWEVPSGKHLGTLLGHQSPVLTADFSPDGRWIVTASEDGTARIWDAATGKEYVTLKGHAGPVRSAAFSPDSRRVVTASADGTGRIWPVDLYAVALARKPRDLTPEERSRFEIPKD